MNEIRVILVDYSREGKLKFYEWKVTPQNNTVQLVMDDGNCETFHVPETLYLNGVREFLYTRGNLNPIDFTTGKHTFITSKELGLMMDRATLSSLSEMEGRDINKRKSKKGKLVEKLRGTTETKS